MKTKILLNLAVILLMAGLFSCEDMVTQPKERDNFAGLKSYDISEEPLAAPVIPYEYCGEIDLFELWYANIEGTERYGTVAIYNDGEKLYIQFDFLEGFDEMSQWSLSKIWLYFGSEFPWEDDGYDPSLDDIDWDDPGMMIIEPGEYDAPLILEFPIDQLKIDYVLEGCFYLALKIKLIHPTESSLLPRAYLNLSDRLDDIWMDKICFDECDYPGTGTPGFWKNHPDAWPVEAIEIGGITYTREEAIALMETPGKGDKTYNLFNHLVSAKLNALMGNPSGCIDDEIMAADAWMAMYGPVGSGVKANSDAWKDIEYEFGMLDDYNNGLLCAPHRD